MRGQAPTRTSALRSSADNGEQTSGDRAPREALHTGAGSRLFTLPRCTETVFWMPGINLHPGDTKTPGSCPATPGSLCHRVPTVMKRERGTGRSSGTALGSPEPDLQVTAPTQSWDHGQACLQAWRQTGMPQCGWRGPGLGGDRQGPALGLCRLPEGLESGPEAERCAGYSSVL